MTHIGLELLDHLYGQWSVRRERGFTWESRGDSSAPLLGAWCADQSRDGVRGLAFCSFLPNALARPGLLENQLMCQAARAQFALRQLRK